ncbi:MAG: hypothetical protein ABIR18_02590 [Chitinophagaceae bacterium]
MTNKITTYEELMAEKARLKILFQQQKEIIRYDIGEIKEELAPVKKAINFIGRITTIEPGNPLVNGTVNSAIDLVVRKLLLAKAGWFTKLVVPFFLKNYTSHVIDEKKDNIIRKVFSWFNKKKTGNKPHESNGKMHPVEEEEED